MYWQLVASFADFWLNNLISKKSSVLLICCEITMYDLSQNVAFKFYLTSAILMPISLITYKDST